MHTHALRATLSGATSSINSIAFAASGNLLVAAAENNEITRWNLAVGRPDMTAGPN
jgi:hypothetical protein